jgi:hypothetical protein
LLCSYIPNVRDSYITEFHDVDLQGTRPADSGTLLRCVANQGKK